MSRAKHATFLVTIFISLFCCQKQMPNWPKHILEALWVPQGVQRIDYYFSKGTYHVRYETEVCYPANDFINSVLNEMKKRGWKRLEYDFLNPGLELNHIRGPGGSWSHFGVYYSKDKIYQWIEDWEDSQKNIVRYILRYTEHMKGGVAEIRCNLEVSEIYLTIEALSTMPKRGIAGSGEKEPTGKR